MLRKTLFSSTVRNFCTGRSLQTLKSPNEGPKEFSCGIPPWRVQPPPPPPPMEVPARLIRPPCMPGSKPGPYQSCMAGQVGLYCPPCRIKYKYPSFSENIDFTPASVVPPCWWKVPATCTGDDKEALEALKGMSARWACAYD